MYKFGVIRTLRQDGGIFISGSTGELGGWNPKASVPLKTNNYVLHEPSFWTVELDIDDVTKVEYKFITIYERDQSVEWEGCGSGDNRTLEVKDKQEQPAGQHKLITPSWWKDNEQSEFQHTTAFYYDRVLRRGTGIHYNKILDRLWLGSCLRQPDHVTELKNLGIDTIMNLQTEEGINKNSAGVVPCNDESDEIIDRLESIYRTNKMAFVWLPTADMTTPARRRVLPEGVALLNLLMNNGRCVYVHCTAGVGRSTAIVAGYLMYVKGMTLKEVMYFLHEKRPVVFIDTVALMEAHNAFLFKYSGKGNF